MSSLFDHLRSPSSAARAKAMRPIRAARMVVVASLMLSCVSALTGCQFQQHRAELAELVAQGNTTGALAKLEQANKQGLYRSNDRLLYLLDRSTLLFQQGDNAQTISNLEDAEQIMDFGGRRRQGDQVLEWLINDTATAYTGEPYESIYANVFKLLAKLRQGEISGGATVEARRILEKSDFLRRRYEASVGQLTSSEKGGTTAVATARKAVSGAAGGRTSQTEGQFIDSPLGLYLAAVALMKDREYDASIFAANRLTTAIEAQGPLIGQVDVGRFVGLPNVRAEDASMLLVALSGRGPTKVANRVGPIPIGDVPIYFEVPELRVFRSQVSRVKATLIPSEPSANQQPLEVELSLIESMSNVASENHRRQLPVIYARTMIRAAIKSGISWGITESIRRNQSGPRRNSNEEALAAVVIGLIAITATERADVRAWATLPGQAHVALIPAPPGTYTVTYDFMDEGGRSVATQVQSNVVVSSRATDLAVPVGWTYR